MLKSEDQSIKKGFIALSTDNVIGAFFDNLSVEPKKC